MKTAVSPGALPPRLPWARIEELFFAASALPPAGRAGFLAAACPGEPELAAEVAALLAAEAESGWLVEAVEAEAGRLAPAAGFPPLVPGEKVGPYRIEREAGRGGMGAVYFAVRDDDEYRREVALKILQPGFAGPEVRAFFRNERQILAELEHPHIARLYDGGTTAEGQLYFAMERVDGEPITVYCERRRLPVAERLRLFLSVCAAVSHAHQKLVVHRDLKPSNILVTAEGIPKLLDFGIARDTGREAEDNASVEAPRLLTPGYASPEQWRGEAVTTAGDVYSLGVILFELLTGRRPLPHGAGGTVETPGRALPAADLDAITARALAPRAAERYGSVEQLAADLRRHLEARPVEARPATWAYRGGRFLVRNRLGLGVAAGVAVLVLAFAVSSWRQAARTATERDKAEEISAFLTDLFLAADPAEARGRAVTARELLDRGAARLERLEREGAGRPEVRAALAETLGRVYVRLGDYPRAEPLLEEALALRRRLRGARHLEVAESLSDLADLRQFQGRYREAEGLYRRALTLRLELLGEDHPAVATSLDSLADALQDAGDYDRAEPLCREALALRRRLFPAPHADLAASLNSLAVLLHYQGRLAEAEPFAREALAMRRQLFGEVHPEVAEGLNNLGTLRDHRGDMAGAEVFLRQAVALEKRLYGADGGKRAGTLQNLGMLLYRRRRWEEAEVVLREALALRHREVGGVHPEYATALHNLALVLVEAGRTAEAERLFRQAIAVYRQSLPPDHPFSAYPVAALGALLLGRGEPAGAEPWLREGLRIHRATLPAGHPSVGQAAGRLGLCEVALGRRAAAAPLLEEACTVAKKALGDGHWRTEEACRTVERFRRGERVGEG